MPSEINAMSNTSKQEENAKKSNEQSTTVMSFYIYHDSNVSAKYINTNLSNVNNDQFSQTSDIRAKFLNSTKTDDVLMSSSSVIINNLLETESLQNETKG